MKISVITLFPGMINSFISESILKRAVDKNLVQIEIVNLRDFSKDSYGTVDDRSYGGGAGMVLMAQPLIEAINNSKSKLQNPNYKSNPKSKEKTVLTSPRGVVYSQDKAREYSKLEHLIIIAGHYEGVDARVSNFVDEEISIGDFVITGGEIAAAAIVDSVVRLIPGVLKKDEASEKESFFEVSVDTLITAIGEDKTLQTLKRKNIKKVRLLEYPQYTRPEEFEGLRVPEILLSGDHAKIEKWRLKMAFDETCKKRPDMIS